MDNVTVPGNENRELYRYQSLRGTIPTLVKMFLLIFVVIVFVEKKLCGNKNPSTLIYQLYHAASPSKINVQLSPRRAIMYCTLFSSDCIRTDLRA